MTPPHLNTPPGPEFVAGLATASGIYRATDYEVPQLFVTHPMPRSPSESGDTIEGGMRRFAAALGLGRGDHEPPVIGSRITIGRALAVLDYGHDEYVMSIPAPSPSWLRLMTEGAPCRIALTLAPLSITATRAETDAHLSACFDRGLIRWGTAYARGLTTRTPRP